MRPEEMVGQTLGHYRILRTLGFGGSAIVLLAEDTYLQREVALKVFQPQEGETQDFLRRFSREARVLARLDHPHILPIYDSGEQDGLAYLVMPYVPGGSLRDRLLKQPRLPLPEVVSLMSQALQALQYAHERGLIHRDIKPGNMLFKADGTLLLSDFGLVKILPDVNNPLLQANTDSMTLHSIAGTPDYMAPEQIEGQAVPATDIYAMGVMLYELLAGVRPFVAENFIGVLIQHLHDQPTPLTTLNPQVSPALNAVVMRAMAKDPTQRYQQPEEMRQALLPAVQIGQSDIPLASTVQALYGQERSLAASAPTLDQSQSSHPGNVYVGSYAPPTTTARQTPLPPPPLPTANAVMPAPQEARRRSRMPILVTLLLLVLVAAVGLGALFSNGTIPGLSGLFGRVQPTPTSQGIISKMPGPTPTSTTSPMNTTITDCPAPHTARPADMAPLALGTHQNLIYVVNEFDAAKNPTYGTLKRKDVTAGSKGVELVKMNQVSISNAQVSTDGQWVLFTAQVGDHSELRLIRVDGKGLQTLYCTPAGQILTDPQWSFDQQSVVFDKGTAGGRSTAYLLDLPGGHLQTEVLPTDTTSFSPTAWLDNTRVYMQETRPTTDVQPTDIYLLDIRRGGNQHSGDLQHILARPLPCTSYDTSFDSRQLFISSCTSTSSTTAASYGSPSSITVRPATGGSPKGVFSSNTLAITAMRVVTPDTILFMVEHDNTDPSQNGLWEIHTDGTGLLRLTTDTDQAQVLCQFSQYAWSNVSRDGNLYALQYYNPHTNEYRLYDGQLHNPNAQPEQFASINDGTTLQIAGWTTMD